MKPDIEQKRETLKALSKVAGLMVKTGEAESINDALVMMYEQQGHTEIHSFKKWLELGYCVMRGEKALLLWGQPIRATNQEAKGSDENDEFKFFPLAYVFSNLQVQPLHDKK